MFCYYLLSPFGLQCRPALTFLYSYCLLDLSNDENGVLKSVLSYWGSWPLLVYSHLPHKAECPSIVEIYILYSHRFPLNPNALLSLFVVVVFKSEFSNTSIATPDHLRFLFAWSRLFILSLLVYGDLSK